MLARKLKELREIRKMSQAELADILDVAQQTVASWERGKSSPNYELLQRIADYFHVSTDYILGREEKRLPFAALPVVGNIIKTLAALSPQKQEQAASYIAFLAQDDKKA